MANHPQALKRHRQSVKSRARNRANRSTLKTAVKKLRAAITENAPKEQIETLYRAAASTIDKTAKKGVIKPRAAGRKIGRLSKAITAGVAAAEAAAVAGVVAPTKPKKAAAKKKK